MKTIARLIVLGFMIACCSSLQAQNYPPDRQIAGSPNHILPPLIGMTVPTTPIFDASGKEFDVNTEFRKKPTVFFYYRGGWDPYAVAFLKQLNEMKGELERAGFQIIAASVDRPSKVKETIAKNGLTFTVLSDSDALMAKTIGIAYRLSPYVLADYKLNKMWDIEEASGRNHHILPVTSVYIMDSRGVLRFPYINPNYKKNLDRETLLAMTKFVKDEEDQRRKTNASKDDDKNNK